ncbi:MAG TPA: hypothetical protein VKA30_10625 [Actinomycetota bacterium]|nr:hypothetical protein [Actinomycetota bacterium]
MGYQWWKFVHVLGVFAFLLSHGVSVGVAVRLRRERDPLKVLTLVQLSGSSIAAFYVSLLLLVGAGVALGFLGHWWSYVWIWAAIAVLVATMGLMYALARPYFRKIRVVAGAMAQGSQAVTTEQFADLLTSSTLFVVMAIGVVGLGLILWLMIMQPHPFGTF